MSSVRKLNSYERSIVFFLKILKVCYLVIWFVNIYFGPLDEKSLVVNVARILILGIWTYALFSALGYIKKAVTEPDKNGIIKYETKIPFVPIVIIRIVEVVYFLIFKAGGVSWRNVFICIGADLLYTFLLLLDKSNYYYESIEIREDQQ